MLKKGKNKRGYARGDFLFWIVGALNTPFIIKVSSNRSANKVAKLFKGFADVIQSSAED